MSANKTCTLPMNDSASSVSGRRRLRFVYHSQDRYATSLPIGQEFETSIKAQDHALSVLSLQKHGAQAELGDLVRTRTELECVIEDLQVAGERGEKRRFVAGFG
jgi:hypothetical protein